MQKTPYIEKATMHELRAFTGLSCWLGVFKPGYVKEKQNWSEITGSPAFKLTLCITRFEFQTDLSSSMARYPDQNEEEMTNSAAIKEVWVCPLRIMPYINHHKFI